MSIHECGTRWRSLSMMFDGTFSIDESVWRFDDGVGNGKKEDVEGKIVSMDMFNCSDELVTDDRD
jgi:hypothetical protein